MIARYFKIKQHIEEIATGDGELTELLLSPAANFSLKACYDDVLSSMGECTKLLQQRHQPLNLAEARTLFDAMIAKHDCVNGSHLILNIQSFIHLILKMALSRSLTMMKQK